VCRVRLPPAVASIALIAALGAILAARPAAPLGKSGSPAVEAVKIDLRATRQLIQGFGTSERVWSDPHLSNSPTTVVPAAVQKTILTALYRRLGLRRVRPTLDPGIQRAPGARFNFSGKLGVDHVAFVKQAKAFGLKVFFPSPVYLEDWMQPDNPSSYVNWAMTVLQYWRSKGLEPPYYSPLNEPEIARDFPTKWMHDVVLQLGRRLAAEGFKTKLVIPDDENPVAAYERSVAVLQDREARTYVGALAYHVYKGSEPDWVRMKDLAARYRLPVWMTEYNDSSYHRWPDVLDWAEKLHGLLTAGGVSAVDYYLGFLGSWASSRGAPLIELRFDDGVFRSLEYTPAYFVTGQYSSYVKPGYRRIATDPEKKGVLTAAFAGTGKVIVVATNTTRNAQVVRYAVVGDKLGRRATVVRSSASEQLRSLQAVAVRRGRFSTVLPPQSVTTLVLLRLTEPRAAR
jgi:O-glycosyl hydrolase